MLALAPPPGEIVRRPRRFSSITPAPRATPASASRGSASASRGSVASAPMPPATGFSSALSGEGVDTQWVERDPARPTGLMLKEPGAGVRYYRSESAASVMGPDALLGRAGRRGARRARHRRHCADRPGTARRRSRAFSDPRAVSVSSIQISVPGCGDRTAARNWCGRSSSDAICCWRGASSRAPGRRRGGRTGRRAGGQEREGASASERTREGRAKSSSAARRPSAS